MKKKAIILSSISAIMLCAALVVGLTVALFTNETAINISVRSGVVQVKAEITNAELYSLQADSDGDVIDEETGTVYKETKCDGNRFANGGTAFVNDDGSIELKNVTAGDKVVFTVAVENESTIPVMFNTLLKLVNQDTNALFDAMDLKIKTEFEGGTLKLGTNGTDNIQRTGWTELKLNEKVTVTIELALPVGLDGSAVQGRTANLQCVMSAIQYTGDLRDCVATIGSENDGEKKSMFFDLADAIGSADNGDVIEIHNSDPNFTGKQIVNKSVTLTSSDGILREMKNVQLVVGDGYAVEFNGLKFTGNSSVDVTGASAFTMKNCTAEAAPEKLFDEGTQSFLPRAAFVASSSVRQTGMRLTLENNAFALAEGGEENSAAVYLAGAVVNGSVIRGNVFGALGAKTTAFGDYAVELRRVGIASGTTVTVAENEFYGAGVKFAQDGATYSFKAVLSGNKVHSEESVLLAEASGTVSAQLLDSGSTVNGAPIGLDDLAATGLCKGVNVTYDVNDRILTGQILVYGMSAEAFKQAYASPMENGLTITEA